MKTNTIVNGLISSLLLSAGLSKLAARFDPLRVAGRFDTRDVPALACVWPCQYVPADVA